MASVSALIRPKLRLFALSEFGVLLNYKERTSRVSLDGNYEPIQSEREVSVKAVTEVVFNCRDMFQFRISFEAVHHFDSW
jgi:hypothetical protein